MRDLAEHVIAREDRLLFGLTPYADESFFGFTARLAAWNHFDSRHQFLSSLGLSGHQPGQQLGRYDLGLRAALADRGGLAWRLRLTDEQLARLTNRQDPELERYRGLITSERRVSPAALRDAPYHRWSWTLAPLPWCTESWEVLIKRCPACERHLGWAGVLDIASCERCGFDLRYASTLVIPKGQRRSLALLAALIDRDPTRREWARSNLPYQLSECSTFDVFALAMIFAKAKFNKFGPREVRSLPPEIRAAHMTAGIEIISKYPESFDRLAGQSNAALPKFFQRVHVSGNGGARAAYEKLFSDWEPCSHGPARLRRKRENSGQLTLREAAARLKLENSALRRLADDGLIEVPRGRGVVRRCQWFDPSSLSDVAIRLEDRMSFQEFSRASQVPIRGVAQLAALNLLCLNDDPIVVALHQAPQLRRATAMQLIARLLALRRVPMADEPLVTLEDAFKGIGGQEKPWGAILRAALERQIPLYCDEVLSFELQVGKLQIPAALAQAILAGHRPELLQIPHLIACAAAGLSMTRGEVEGYLNCFPRDLSWLLAEGHLPEELPLAAVTALGRTVISSREISWRWRVSPALRDGLAGDHGIKRTLGPFWSRVAIEEHFARLFPHGRPT